MKSLIFNADDLGLSDKTSQGIFRCFEKGLVKSASLMITSNFDVSEIQNYIAKGLSVGIHLNVSGPGKFLTANGDLFGRNGIVNNAIKNRISLSEKEFGQVTEEFNKQVSLFASKFGRNPSHINFHHPLYEIPGLTEKFVGFLKKYNLPTRWYSDMGNLYFSHPDYTEFGFFEEKTLTISNLISLIDCAPDGITEIVLHPGLFDSTLDSSYKSEREKQVKVLTDNKVIEHVKSAGYKIISFDEIK